MGEQKVDSMVGGTEAEVKVTAFSVDSQHTDAPTGQKETTWMDDEFPIWLGYYKDERPQR